MKQIRKSKFLTKVIISLLDILILTASLFLALLIRFDFSFSGIPAQYLATAKYVLPCQIIILLICFSVFRLYRYIWHSVCLQDVVHMAVSIFITDAIMSLLQFIPSMRMPISVLFMQFVFSLLLFITMRCSVRIFSELAAQRQKRNGERIMVIGAGAAGRMILQEIHNNTSKNAATVSCIIDDNPVKTGKYLDGIRIVGNRDSIPAMVKGFHITQIILAIPSADNQTQREILQICSTTGCRIRKLPSLYQLVDGTVSLSHVQDVQIEDLLGRDTISLDLAPVHTLLSGKVVLVTGGGGSIGSELCRQIARHDPKQLIILDIYENNAYDIQQELRRTYGASLNMQVEIASVRDKAQIENIFARYRPELIFHAAAHKHVPLMEHNPIEAIKNNIFGTYHVVRAAEKYGVQKFVMISTDKAVNPTNFMGATKRFCEMILQSRFESKTEFCCVRFGNVLGSNGSVIPLFKQQIANGGPITITDRRIIRYFMTIPEAVQLVLSAGAMAKQGQIFVLDMGEPVKILDLAENLIRLSGLEPYVDIDIREVGLRPGEKLYEELLIASNTLSTTDNAKIFVEQQDQIDPDHIMTALQAFDTAVSNHVSNEELISLLRKYVPTYVDPDAFNREKVSQ